MRCYFKPFFLLCLALCGYIVSQAQYRYYPQPQYMEREDTVSHKGFDKQKLFIGGNLGLTFGDVTYINLSPDAGYRFSKLFAAGIQINSMYESVRYYDPGGALTEKDRYGMVGAGIFGRVYPLQQFFIQLQPEMNFIFGNSTFYDGTSSSGKYREKVPSMLGGIGYSQSAGGTSAFTIMILYDFLQKPDSPYGKKPIFRVGMDLGL